MSDAVLLAIIALVGGAFGGLWTAFATETVVSGSRFRSVNDALTKATEALTLAKDTLWETKLELERERIRREIEMASHGHTPPTKEAEV